MLVARSKRPSAGVPPPFTKLPETVNDEQRRHPMQVHLVNPSDTAFGTAVITPRWRHVLSAATPVAFGARRICAETLRKLDLSTVQARDVIALGIHTSNARRGRHPGIAV